MKKFELNMSLCEGRHEIPAAIDGAVFSNTMPSDILLEPDVLESWALNAIWDKCWEPGQYCTSIRRTEDGHGLLGVSDGGGMYIHGERIHLNLYVTGLSVCLVAVINFCHECGIELTLYHYDRESGEYYTQQVA